MRKHRYGMAFVLVLALVFVGTMVDMSMAAEDVPKITKEELKGKLGQPDIVIVDVRTERDWKSSDWKIQGAVREDPSVAKSWISKYPKDKKLVLYCA